MFGPLARSFSLLYFHVIVLVACGCIRCGDGSVQQPNTVRPALACQAAQQQRRRCCRAFQDERTAAGKGTPICTRASFRYACLQLEYGRLSR